MAVTGVMSGSAAQANKPAARPKDSGAAGGTAADSKPQKTDGDSTAAKQAKEGAEPGKSGGGLLKGIVDTGVKIAKGAVDFLKEMDDREPVSARDAYQRMKDNSKGIAVERTPEQQADDMVRRFDKDGDGALSSTGDSETTLVDANSGRTAGRYSFGHVVSGADARGDGNGKATAGELQAELETYDDGGTNGTAGDGQFNGDEPAGIYRRIE